MPEVRKNIIAAINDSDLTSPDEIVDAIYIALLMTPDMSLHSATSEEPADYRDVCMFIRGCMIALKKCNIPITPEMIVNLLISDLSFSVHEDDGI